MRGSDSNAGPMFVYVTTEHFVPKKHPLRTLKPLVDAALSKLDREFDTLYSSSGRPSVPPEYLLRGLVLQFLYSIRSFPMLMDRIHSDMAFRWFIGLSIDDAVWDQSVFSYNQKRLIKADIASRFLEEVNQQAKRKGLLSSDHFSVDGTLLESLASSKSFRRWVMTPINLLATSPERSSLTRPTGQLLILMPVSTRRVRVPVPSSVSWGMP